MRITQKHSKNGISWNLISDENNAKTAQLAFVFGSRELISNPEVFAKIQTFSPDAHIIGCSTAGEIIEDIVYDNSLAFTAIEFEHTKVHIAQQHISDVSQSLSIGKKLAEQLPQQDLQHVFILSDGLNVNGTALVRGLNSKLPQHVAVTGGLAGDGTDFKHTLVSLNGVAEEKNIIAIGFYGPKFQVGYGSFGGWDTFGAERTITKSDGNILYELDGEPALDLYKQYLGPQASELPASGLLFPLRIQQDTGKEVVRTILGIDENTKSMTFAGDMPQGSRVQMMRANFDRLVEGAEGAAKMSLKNAKNTKPQLAILISCVGRKLILKQRVDEEVESVQDTLGDQTPITGFYSYGEICPTAATEKQCELHNQTMTITTFSEES